MIGKSLFAMHEVKRAVDEGRSVKLMTVEMTNKEIVERFSSNIFKDFKVTKNRYPFTPTRSTSTMNLDLHLDFIASQSKITNR